MPKIRAVLTLKDFFSEAKYLHQGTRLILYLLVGTGLAGFFFETSAIIAMQIFLNTLNLLKSNIAPILSFQNLTPIEILLILILLFLLRFISQALRSYLIQMIYQSFLMDFRDRILKASFNSYKDFKSYESNAMFNELVFQAGSYWQQLAIFTMNFVLLVMFSAFCLLKFDILFISTVIIVSTVYIVFKFFFKKLFSSKNEIVQQSIKLSKGLTESLRNLFYIKVNNIEDRILEINNYELRKYYSNYRAYAIRTSIETILPQIIGVLTILIILYAFTLQQTPKPHLDVLTFFYMFIRVAQSAGEVITNVTIIEINKPGWIKLKNWLTKNKPTNDQHSTTKPREASDNVLAINDASFSYGDNLIFDKLNACLSPGDICQISGKSGSGKSTLISLLIGLQRPTSGSIFISGHDPYSSRDYVSKLTSYVGPTSYFIEGTLRENLIFGHPYSEKISDSAMIEVLVKTSVYDEITSQGITLDYYLNESVPLSTGQKQRISIARALLKQPQILILDEATSNIDQRNELIIMNLLTSIRENLIIIFVSHMGNISMIANKKIDLEGNSIDEN